MELIRQILLFAYEVTNLVEQALHIIILKFELLALSCKIIIIVHISRGFVALFFRGTLYLVVGIGTVIFDSWG